MTLQDKLLLIYTTATVVQVVVVAVSVIFIYWQARETRRSVENIEQAGRIDTYLNHRRDAQDINRLLLVDGELSALLGYKKQEILAFVFLGHAETMFRYKQEATMSEEVWKSMRRLIDKILEMEFVVALWPKVRGEYTPDFASFVDDIRMSRDQEAHTDR